jgi:Ras-related protein Rab-1A
MDENNKNDKTLLTLKLLIIGDSRVGKTSLLLNYVEKIFPEAHISTLGVEYKEKEIIKDNYIIRLQIWDTAGEERFRSITKSIYRNANGILFVCDITNRESFKNIKNWIKDADNVDKDIKGIIIGNKIDLDNERVVSVEDLEEIGKKYNMPFIETSAKTGMNINKCFEVLIDELFKNKNADEIKEEYLRKNKNDLSISTKKTNVKEKGGCC